ncbi:MAG TPA: hypothetical protein VFH27_02155 [Longimicrobiaceae bacterium]|nr:hypothetical protein [Longimicrobiaceae bacterium]
MNHPARRERLRASILPAARLAGGCAAFVAIIGAFRLPSLTEAAVTAACVFALMFVLAVLAQAFGGRPVDGKADVELSRGCVIAGLLGAIAFFVGIYFLVAP